jgi:hypothetical protein
MAQAELRRPSSEKEVLRELQRWMDTALGNAPGRLWLVADDDGDRKDIRTGTVLASAEYRSQVRSGAGNHGAYLLSGTAAKATPSTTNSAVLIQDAGLSVGASLALKLFGAGGTNHSALSSDANGGTVVGGSGSGAGALSSVSLTLSTGNLIFAGTAQRITGDLSNGTHANRLMIQNSVANGNSLLGLLPNGTATSAAFNAYGSSNPAASAIGQFGVNAGVDVRLTSSHAGAAYLPITFFNNGAEQMRIAANGDITIGTAAGKIGLFGATPVAQQSVAAAATDLASVITLANSIRTNLRTRGDFS